MVKENCRMFPFSHAYRRSDWDLNPINVRLVGMIVKEVK